MTNPKERLRLDLDLVLASWFLNSTFYGKRGTNWDESKGFTSLFP